HIPTLPSNPVRPLDVTVGSIQTLRLHTSPGPQHIGTPLPGPVDIVSQDLKSETPTFDRIRRDLERPKPDSEISVKRARSARRTARSPRRQERRPRPPSGLPNGDASQTEPLAAGTETLRSNRKTISSHLRRDGDKAKRQGHTQSRSTHLLDAWISNPPKGMDSTLRPIRQSRGTDYAKTERR